MFHSCEVHNIHPDHKGKTIKEVEDLYNALDSFREDWELSREAVIEAKIEERVHVLFVVMCGGCSCC